MSLIQGYINGTESGWLESKYPGLAKAQFDLLNGEGLFSTPLQTTDIPDHFSMHSVARKFSNKDVGGGVQLRGDCVSWGGKHTSEYLQCVLGLLKFRKVNFRSVFAPYYYGISRTYIGRGQLGDNDDGSLGSWLAEAVQKYGTLFDDDEGVPAYSSEVARRWGDRNSRDDLDKFVNVAKEFLVKSVAKINSWQELCAALANGYPCTVASMVGFEMQPDRQGYHRRKGQWAHQMMIYGYSNPYKCGYIANSWGDVHGRLKDFHSDEFLPVGTIRAPQDAIEHMIATGEVYTFGDMDGFPERSRDIERELFDLIGEK